MTCPNTSYFTTDAITLVWVILIIMNLSLVIYTASTTETFSTLAHSTCNSHFSDSLI
jgi:hypothetical protein